MNKITSFLQNKWDKYLENHPTFKKYFEKVQKVFKLIEKVMTFLISMISLLFTYVIGFGTTSLVAKIVGKKFILKKVKSSRWTKTNYSDSFNESMY